MPKRFRHGKNGAKGFKSFFQRPGGRIQVIIVPSSVHGNLTDTILSARRAADTIRDELNGAYVWIEESGMSRTPSALSRAGTVLGWLILIGLIAAIIYFVASNRFGARAG